MKDNARKYFIFEDELEDGIVTIGDSNVWWVDEKKHLLHSALRARTPKGWLSQKRIKLEPWKVLGDYKYREGQKRKSLQIDTEQAERLIAEYDSKLCKIYSKPIDTITGFALAYAKMDAERQGPESLEWP